MNLKEPYLFLLKTNLSAMEVIMGDMVTEVTAEVMVEVTEEAMEVTMDDSQTLMKPKLSFQKQAMQC